MTETMKRNDQDIKWMFVKDFVRMYANEILFYS